MFNERKGLGGNSAGSGVLPGFQSWPHWLQVCNFKQVSFSVPWFPPLKWEGDSM